MRIVVHVNSYYDWERVPDGVEVTEKDLALGRVKKDQYNNFVMRVIRRGDTHTTIAMPENQLIAEIIDHFIHKHVPLTRKEAAAMHASRVMVDHAHRQWMMRFEIHDDGPDEVLFRKMLEAHVNPPTHNPTTGEPLVDPRPTIAAEDVDELVEAYLEPVTNDEHVDHHHAHFRVQPPPMIAAPLAPEPPEAPEAPLESPPEPEPTPAPVEAAPEETAK